MTTKAEKIGLDPEKLRQFLNQQMQNQQEPQTDADTSETGEASDPTSENDDQLQFDLIPEELENHLNQYVIGQKEAKAVLSTKICTHFNRIKLASDEDNYTLGNIKNNVLLIGPTGVGKTYLIKLIANKIGVPFVKGDATKFSETGYVGGDVEDLVRELVREADGDIKRAECGIIYIDEIDKIASARDVQGLDVSRSGVQRNLLKLMEETDVDLKTPHDVASQMEAVMQMQQGGKIERKKVNTGNILFIVSGAFSNIDEIVARRLNRHAIGFNTHLDKTEQNGGSLYNQINTEDLVEYGFESEFVGRLPVVAILHELAEGDLLSILRNRNSSVILSKKCDFRAYGIEIEFTDEALQLLAAHAYKERIGARSLVGAVERALLQFERKLPSTSIRKLVVDSNIVRNPTDALKQILRSSSLTSFTDSFSEKSGIKLSFTPEAENLVMKLSEERNIEATELCHELFSDYVHGLKLAGRVKFEISKQAVQTPEEVINNLIKAHYDKADDD